MSALASNFRSVFRGPTLLRSALTHCKPHAPILRRALPYFTSSFTLTRFSKYNNQHFGLPSSPVLPWLHRSISSTHGSTKSTASTETQTGSPEPAQPSIEKTFAQKKDSLLAVSSIPSYPLALGVAGLIPFVSTAAAGTFYPHLFASMMEIQSAYGACILSFMGAVWWGVEMASKAPPKQGMYIASVSPALVAFTSLLVPSTGLGLLIQASGFFGLLLYDVGQWRRGVGARWYPALRIPLTAVVLLSLGWTIFLGRDYI